MLKLTEKSVMHFFLKHLWFATTKLLTHILHYMLCNVQPLDHIRYENVCKAVGCLLTEKAL